MKHASRLEELLFAALGHSADKPAKKSTQLRKKAELLQKEARKMLNMVPAGQPIHSTADRNRREKSFEKAMRAVDLIKQAEELEKEGK